MIVYTAVFGEYSDPHPQPVDDGTQYIYLSDKKGKQVDPWHRSITQTDVINGAPNTNLRSAHRFWKICKFPESQLDDEILFWIGSTITLKRKPSEFIDEFMNGYDIVVAEHPHRSSVFRECSAVVELGKGSSKSIMPYANAIRADGFNDDVGLSACYLVIRRNTDTMTAFNREWYEHTDVVSNRDQLTFDYLCWKYGMKVNRIPRIVEDNWFHWGPTGWQ